MRRTVIALGCGVLVLAGCSTNGTGQAVPLDSGQAAVSTDFRVSQNDVADVVASVLSGLGQPPGEPPAGLASGTTERLVLDRLITSYAAENDIGVTQAQIEDGVAQLADKNGGIDALEQLAFQSGIPADALEDTVRINLLVTAIGQKLNGDGAADAQLEAARVALSAYSDAIDVSVAPRYGTWDDEQLAIVPGSSVTTDSAAQ